MTEFLCAHKLSSSRPFNVVGPGCSGEFHDLSFFISSNDSMQYKVKLSVEQIISIVLCSLVHIANCNLSYSGPTKWNLDKLNLANCYKSIT